MKNLIDIKSHSFDIVYVDNFTNFYLYLEVAKKSSKKWYFIVFTKEKYELCVDNKIKCFLMPRMNLFGDTAEYVKNFEIYNKSISRDRILKFLPTSISRGIISSQLNIFSLLIKSLNPKLILGEISWANEHVFYTWSKNNGYEYRHMLNLPLKENKIVMFDDEHSYASLEKNPEHVVSVLSSGVSYEYLCKKLTQYNKKSKFSVIKSLYNFLNFDAQLRDYRYSSVYYKIYGLIIYGYKKIQVLFKSSDRYASSLDEIFKRSENKKIIFFPLHIQPEATPDFVANDCNDQFYICERMLESVSDEYVVVLKDHPNNISIRNPFKIFKLLQRRNFIYADRSIPSSKIIEKSVLVATIAGTAALEAISSKIPAIVFSNIFYNKSRFVKYIKNFSEINDYIASLKDVEIFNDLAVDKFGVVGFVHDPVIFPEVTDERNVRSINQLIDLYMERQSSGLE